MKDLTKERTLDEIRQEGLAALRERLGAEGMVRFLQQFEHGSGDWASQRREWVKRTSLDDLRQTLHAIRKGRQRRRAG